MTRVEAAIALAELVARQGGISSRSYLITQYVDAMVREMCGPQDPETVVPILPPSRMRVRSTSELLAEIRELRGRTLKLSMDKRLRDAKREVFDEILALFEGQS